MKNAAKEAEVKAGAVQETTTTLEGSELGEVKIHENVIASLVRRAVLGVEGVSRLAGNALVDNIAEIVGSRRMQARAITVMLENDNRVNIEIKVNIKFGYRLPELAVQIQKAVIDSVESVTGMVVPKVDVLIQEIEDPVEESDDEAENADSTQMIPPVPMH